MRKARRDAAVSDEWSGCRARLLCGGSRDHQRQSRRSVASAGLRMSEALGEVQSFGQPATQKRGHAEPLLERLAGCIDKGRAW